MADDADDAQPWAFLCLTAIAFNESQISMSGQTSSVPKTAWSNCWTHALRRTSSMSTSRAACHLAHTLLDFYRLHSQSASKSPLGATEVLSQIENLLRDVDVQGPSYPFDSTCHFLALCLQVSSQDARLYRLHLEEKALAWLQASWKDGGSGQLCHTVPDMLSLLESICNTPHEYELTSSALFPEGLVAQALAQHYQERVVRDFSITGKLPSAYLSSSSQPKSDTISVKDDLPPDSECKVPEGVTLRVALFLQKRVEMHVQDDKASTKISAKVAHDHLSDAIIALLFQALLRAQALRIQPHLVHASQELILIITEHLRKSVWDVQQKALVSTALDLLISRDSEADGMRWSGMIYPGVDTGVPQQKRQVLAPPTSRKISRVLQQIIWRDMHVRYFISCLVFKIIKLNPYLESRNSRQALSYHAGSPGARTGHGQSRR